MMTLAAQLCTLCAVNALMQLALGDTPGAGSLRMIGGLLMVHLVITGGQQMTEQLAAQRDLGQIFQILMQ